MIDLRKRRVRHRAEEDEIAHEVHDSHRHPVRSHATSLWIGIGSLVIGAGSAIYGAQQQKKANSAALAQNASQNAEQNTSAWSNYLMTRGISPTSALAAGQMPTTGNFVATNTRLPLWAGFTTTKGENGAPNTYALATPAMGGYIGGPTEAELAAQKKQEEEKKPGRLLEALDPLGIIGGSKPSLKKAMDPLGFF